MSEPGSEYRGSPAIPAWCRVMAERAPERRRPVLDAIQTLIAVRDLVLAPGAADRTNQALVDRVRELVDRERLDEGDGR